jgi:hypothetical protein
MRDFTTGVNPFGALALLFEKRRMVVAGIPDSKWAQSSLKIE